MLNLVQYVRDRAVTPSFWDDRLGPSQEVRCKSLSSHINPSYSCSSFRTGKPITLPLALCLPVKTVVHEVEESFKQKNASTILTPPCDKVSLSTTLNPHPLHPLWCVFNLRWCSFCLVPGGVCFGCCFFGNNTSSAWAYVCVHCHGVIYAWKQVGLQWSHADIDILCWFYTLISHCVLAERK